MKTKMILGIIGFGLVMFIGFGLIKARQLQEIAITKQVTIKADRQATFDMVKYLNNFPKWSPFLAVDPTQKVKVVGTDGQIGAQYHWEGNGGKDLGYQEIIGIEELKAVHMRCEISKPFQARPTFDYFFEGDDGQVTVRQEFKLSSGLVDAFFMWLFGAKKNISKMNEKGMAMLKEQLEQ